MPLFKWLLLTADTLVFKITFRQIFGLYFARKRALPPPQRALPRLLFLNIYKFKIVFNNENENNNSIIVYYNLFCVEN